MLHKSFSRCDVLAVTICGNHNYKTAYGTILSPIKFGIQIFLFNSKWPRLKGVAKVVDEQ